MNSPEFMSGTNRFVIKARDNSKIIITRDYIDDSLNYIADFTCDLENILSENAKECGYVIMISGISIEENIVTLTGTLMENVALKEEYHVIDDALVKLLESYVPYPEETTVLIPITFCLDQVKEITGDLEMIQDMVDENMLDATTRDLINYGIIIEPQLSVIRSDKTKQKDYDAPDSKTEKVISPLLTIINGRCDKNKVKKQ